MIARWTDCFRFNGDAVELVVESAVLYTAAMVIGEGKHDDLVNLSPLIKKCKKFADDNFCDSTLTLNSVAAALFYIRKRYCLIAGGAVYIPAVLRHIVKEVAMGVSHGYI